MKTINKKKTVSMSEAYATIRFNHLPKKQKNALSKEKINLSKEEIALIRQMLLIVTRELRLLKANAIPRKSG